MSNNWGKNNRKIKNAPKNYLNSIQKQWLEIKNFECNNFLIVKIFGFIFIQKNIETNFNNIFLIIFNEISGRSKDSKMFGRKFNFVFTRFYWTLMEKVINNRLFFYFFWRINNENLFWFIKNKEFLTIYGIILNKTIKTIIETNQI